MRPLSLSMLLMGFFTTSVSAACLDDLTEVTVEAKQCSIDGRSCDDTYRQFEIQRLTCIRDGFAGERVRAAIQLGDAMVTGDRQPNPTADWVSLRIDELVKDQLRDVSARLDALERSAGGGSEDRLTTLNAELLKVQGQVNGLMLDRAVNGGDVPPDLSLRLKTIEERLKAIDAARASINAELLKVQGQVNGLMLDRSVR